jgi:predicted DNA-binding transcriptional regulator AlpA
MSQSPGRSLQVNQQQPIPLLLDAHRAAAVCGTSARTWRAWDVAGKVPAPIRIGRRTFWRAEDLRGWVAAGCPDRLTWEALRE